MTEKQNKFIESHGLGVKLRNIGLDINSLTVKQASDIIAKFYENQEKYKEQEKSESERELEWKRLMGQSPDRDRYPTCGYDRSWCG